MWYEIVQYPAILTLRLVNNIYIYVSTLTERAVADQITEHMLKNNLHATLQSGY